MTRSPYQRSATGRQTAERGARVTAEHRRIRRQYTRALDRRLRDDIPDNWADGYGAYRPAAAARMREQIAAEQQFTEHARRRLVDVLACLDWPDIDADEVLRRLDAAVAALRRHRTERRDNP